MQWGGYIYLLLPQNKLYYIAKAGRIDSYNIPAKNGNNYLVKQIEKYKVQKLIKKIESGSFDENDVDSLFMRLRAYSGRSSVFREIADFVAHNDQRDRGLINQCLEAFYLRMKYFEKYQSVKKTLNVLAPFPSWIKKLMQYQVDMTNEKDLRTKYNVSKARLKIRVDKGFIVDKKTKTARANIRKLSADTLEAVQHAMSFIYAQPAFTQDVVINQLLDVIEANNIEYDRSLFLDHSDRLTLCILLLLHNVTYDIGGQRIVSSYISTEKLSISHNTKFVDADGTEVENIETFGKLHIVGHNILDNDGKDITLVHTVFATNLDVIEWCADELFKIEPVDEKMPNYLCKRIILDGDLIISDAFMLTEFKA